MGKYTANIRQKSSPQAQHCNSDPDLLRLLLDDLHQLRIYLAEVFLIFAIGSLSFLLLAFPSLRDHHHTGRPFRGASRTQLRARRDEDVGNTMIFAEYGDVGDDVHGRDVCGKNHDAWRFWNGDVCLRDRGLAKGLDDFFHTPFQRLVRSG